MNHVLAKKCQYILSDLEYRHYFHQWTSLPEEPNVIRARNAQEILSDVRWHFCILLHQLCLSLPCSHFLSIYKLVASQHKLAQFVMFECKNPLWLMRPLCCTFRLFNSNFSIGFLLNSFWLRLWRSSNCWEIHLLTAQLLLVYFQGLMGNYQKIHNTLHYHLSPFNLFFLQNVYKDDLNWLKGIGCYVWDTPQILHAKKSYDLQSQVSIFCEIPNPTR